MLSLLTQREAAGVLRLSERTLERLRLTGTGPAFVKAGRWSVIAKLILKHGLLNELSDRQVRARSSS